MSLPAVSTIELDSGDDPVRVQVRRFSRTWLDLITIPPHTQATIDLTSTLAITPWTLRARRVSAGPLIGPARPNGGRSDQPVAGRRANAQTTTARSRRLRSDIQRR